ncbi:hypothetical protein N0V90_005141 [Kalmusia sp. IMI 367209]|nr:hypothetical protein N0V90_005141 [Kalmusia sp. IMI 367209]
MSSIIPVDLLAAATNPAYFTNLVTTNASDPSTIALLSFNDTFRTNILGDNATARRLYNLDWEAFHEMGTYNKETNKIYVTSNFQSLDNPINITVIDLVNDYAISSTRYPDVNEANGGTNWYPPGSNQSTTPPRLLFCDEGDFDHYSGLVSVDPVTNKSEVILNSYLGRNFSSVNDVRQHPVTGDLWFTDAAYGYYQDFRPVPTIPQQVYRFNPSTGEIAVVADGFTQSNGLEFSPDLKTLYVTDTGAFEFALNASRPATIYAFDIVGEKRLENRRTFAYVDNGFPDGIHADTEGNVWAGCGDGVHVWSPEGVLLGKVWIGLESNNFAFIPGGVLVFSNAQLWLVEGVKAVGREICANGFVAAHILAGLIERKYHIVATVRADQKAKELIELHPDWESHITFAFVPDITAEGAFDEVFSKFGSFDYIIHNASPLNFSVTDIREEIIRPAIEGTVGLISCAHKAGGPTLKRFVLLGSAVAILNEFDDYSKAGKPYTEADWNPVTADYAVENKNVVAGYNASKKLAEQAAWKYMDENKPNFDLTVINPDIIIGPMLQYVPGPKGVNETNTFAVYSFLNGTHKSIEGLKFPFYHFVDVRDVARAHIEALTRPTASNKRIILVSGLISPQLVINTIRKHFPNLKDRVAEGQAEQLLPPGVDPTGWDTSRSYEIFSPGWSYIGLEESVVDTVKSLLEHEEVWKQKE